jgi:dihydroorotate dehydrogenase electron transfer subunit
VNDQQHSTVSAADQPQRCCAIDTTVVESRMICREHSLIVVEARDFPPSIPGQFLQVRCTGAEQGFPLLRRPFSIADRTDSGSVSRLSIISRSVGVGTHWLEQLSAGDRLNITGPLGRGFRLPADRGASILLVGGGVGIPPLLYLARVLSEQGFSNVVVVFGVLSGELFPVELIDAPPANGSAALCLKLPGDAAYPAIITTDDGSLGLQGRVTDAVESWHRRRAEQTSVSVYTCGPEPMLAAVADQTRRLGYEAQLCIERMMGCGLGTCLSCIVKLPDVEGSQGWRWGLSCQEGPVFDRDELLELSPGGR